MKDEAWQGDLDYENKLERAAHVLDYFGYEFGKVVIPSHPQAPIKRNLALLSQAMRRESWHAPLHLPDGAGDANQQNWTLSSACRALGVSWQQAPALVLRGYVAMDIVGEHMKADTPVYPSWGDLEHLRLVRRMMQ